MYRYSVLRSVRVPCALDTTPTRIPRLWFAAAAAGKHQHRLKYAGSGRKKRESMKAERLRYDRAEIAARDLHGGMGWGGPILFLGVAPLFLWLVTVYMKPDLRRELVQAVTTGPNEGKETETASTPP
jgi:hypothetical protein